MRDQGCFLQPFQSFQLNSPFQHPVSRKPFRVQRLAGLPPWVCACLEFDSLYPQCLDQHKPQVQPDSTLSPLPFFPPWPMNQKCTPSSIDHIIKNAQFDNGAVPSVLSNLPQAWILGISPGIFFASRHQVVSDSSQDSGFQWNGPNSLSFSSLRSPISQSGLTSPPTKSIEPRDPANLGLPSCCEKKPSLFFQEKRTDGTDVSIYIYIHLFIYSLFVQHMYIIYTYMCMPISIVKLETRLKLCRPVFTKKQSFKFPVVGNGILNATSGWELHCSSMQRYAPTQGLEAAESRLRLCQMAGITTPSEDLESRKTWLWTTCRRQSSALLKFFPNSPDCTIQILGIPWHQKPTIILSNTENNAPFSSTLSQSSWFNVAAIKSTKGADSPSPKKERVSAVEDVPPSWLSGKQRLCQRHKSYHAFHVRIGLLPPDI